MSERRVPEPEPSLLARNSAVLRVRAAQSAAAAVASSGLHGGLQLGGGAVPLHQRGRWPGPVDRLLAAVCATIGVAVASTASAVAQSSVIAVAPAAWMWCRMERRSDDLLSDREPERGASVLLCWGRSERIVVAADTRHHGNAGAVAPCVGGGLLRGERVDGDVHWSGVRQLPERRAVYERDESVLCMHGARRAWRAVGRRAGRSYRIIAVPAAEGVRRDGQHWQLLWQWCGRAGGRCIIASGEPDRRWRHELEWLRPGGCAVPLCERGHVAWALD